MYFRLQSYAFDVSHVSPVSLSSKSIPVESDTKGGVDADSAQQQQGNVFLSGKECGLV